MDGTRRPAGITEPPGPCYNPGRLDSARHRSPSQGSRSEDQANSPLGANSGDERKVLAGYSVVRWGDRTQRFL